MRSDMVKKAWKERHTVHYFYAGGIIPEMGKPLIEML